MIYELVEIHSPWERPRLFSDSTITTLKELKRAVHYGNAGCIARGDKIMYAIACRLPDEALVIARGRPHPMPIVKLSSEERERFWKWYGSEFNTGLIPSQALFPEVSELAN